MLVLLVLPSDFRVLSLAQPYNGLTSLSNSSICFVTQFVSMCAAHMSFIGCPAGGAGTRSHGNNHHCSIEHERGCRVLQQVGT